MTSPKIVQDVHRLAKRLATLSKLISKATNSNLPFFKILKGAKKFKWNSEYKKAFIKLKEYLTKPKLLSKPKSDEELSLYLVVSLTTVNMTFI